MFEPATMLPPLVGYALLFQRQSSVRQYGRRHLFLRDAFDHFLGTSTEDVYGCVEHDGNKIGFASTARGNLLIDSDEKGLFVIALPRNDGYGRMACALIQNGHADKMSAGVLMKRIPHNPSDIDRVDFVRRAGLFEVSAVARPSIPNTCIYVAMGEHRLPRTRTELMTEDCRLRALNLEHAKAGTLAEWKRRKATERCELLKGIKQQHQQTIAG